MSSGAPTGPRARATGDGATRTARPTGPRWRRSRRSVRAPARLRRRPDRGAGPARGDRRRAVAAAPAREPRRDPQRRTRRTGSATRWAAPTATSSAVSAAGSSGPRTWSPSRATRRTSAASSSCAPSAGSRRSRSAAGPASSAASSPGSAAATAGAVSLDLGGLSGHRRDRRGLGRGADPGRHARPRARGRPPAARPHPAPLPAVVRVLDARRLDRDPRRRPLRDRADAHRRPRRLDPRADAGGAVGEPAPARLRRRPEPRPDAARLGGHPRRHHRGLGPGPAAADASRRPGRVLFPSFAAGAEAARVIAQSGLQPRRTAGCSTRSRRETTGAGDGSAAVLILGFESAFAPVDDLLRLAVECAADHGGTPEPEPDDPARRRRTGLRGADLALGLPRRALPARQPRRARRDQRDVRDRDHVGPLRRVPLPRHRGGPPRRRRGHATRPPRARGRRG